MDGNSLAENKIIWGSKPASEVVLKSTDTIMLDTDLLKDQFQTDGSLCLYLVMVAQRMLRKDSTLRASFRKEHILKGIGLKEVAEVNRNNIGTQEMEKMKLRKVLEEDNPAGTRLVLGLSDDRYVGRPLGESVVNMLKEGLLPGIIITREGHAVLGVGYSQDEKELIVWDALRGPGNPRMRRLSKNRDDLEFVAAVEIQPEFKNPIDRI